MIENKKIADGSVRSATTGRVIQYIDTNGAVKTKDENGLVKQIAQFTDAQVAISPIGVAALNASNQLINAAGTVISAGGGSSIAVSDEGSSLTSAAASFNFVGAGVTATNSSGAITVTVPGATSGIAVQDEGSAQGQATTVNFVGAGVTAAFSSGTATVTIPGATGTAITAQDEGSNLTTSAASFNFVGAGVTATNSGNAVTITVPGASAAVQTYTADVVASRTLVTGDLQSLLPYNSASDGILTIPTDATLGISGSSNYKIDVFQKSTGRPSFTAGSGVTLNIWTGYPTSAQYVTQTIQRVGANTWAVV